MSIMFDSNYPGADEERERRLDEEAVERVRRRKLMTSEFRPDHDSLFVRFNQLLIQADGTLDAQATLTLPTPSSSYSLRVSGRLVVDDWNGGRLLALGFGDTLLGAINAERTALGNKIELELCHGPDDCFDTKLVVDAGSEHLFVLEISDAQTKLTVDCVPFASLSGSALNTSDSLSLVFGKVDGDPIDATLDDVLVSYE